MENEKKKNEYTTGFASNGFNALPDFDSLSRAGEKKAVNPTPQNVPVSKPSVEEQEKKSEVQTVQSITPKPVEKVESAPKVKKKSKGFGILCALLIIAIIATTGFAGYNTLVYAFSSSEKGDEVEGYNAYSELSAKYKSTKYPSGIQDKFTNLYASNSELAGWLYIPGTNVNTPIVQNKSNDHYLRNNFFGTYTNYGQAYLSAECKKKSLSKNTIIFGHNMPSGTHFYDVNRYENLEWYKQHPIIKYSTLKQDYTFAIYTAFYATVDPADDDGYAFNYISANMSDSNFKGYIKQVDQRALYKTAVTLKSTDKIIILSTCNHTYDSMCGRKVNTRLVVIGRLLRNNESDTIDTSAAKENPDYRKPQVYYSKHGKTNPYAGTEKWVPSAK